MRYPRAKKSLGQNFLKKGPVLDHIIQAGELSPADIILEIGPGHGVLTEKIAPLVKHLICIEKDDNLFHKLHTTFSSFIESGVLMLENKDILKYSPESLRQLSTTYKIIANIPYNITGAIIEKFLSESFQPSMMVLMVQKEVADRIVAKDKKTGGQGKESILSIAVKAYGIPEYICTVKAGNFVPAPKIDSAVIKIKDISRKNFINNHHEEVFFQLIKAGFAHKRKTLAGNLKNILEPDQVVSIFEKLNKPITTRAEDLGISDWLHMSQLVYNNQYGNE